MKRTYTRGHELRPPAAPAAQIKTYGLRRKRIPRENAEIRIEQFLQLFASQSGLIIVRPLLAEAVDYVRVDIFRDAMSK